MSVNITKIKSLNVIYSSTQDELGPAVVDAIGAGVSLQDANLAGVDFSGLDLTGGDFQRADLTGAVLVETNLTDADFRLADLSGADLTDATVTRADFRHATLNNVTTTGTDFSTATLQGAAIVAVDGSLGIGVAPVVASISRVLYVNPDVPAGNTIEATTLETAFASTCTIPADLLQVGDSVRMRLLFSYALDGVALDVRVKLGAVTLYQFAPVDSAAEPLTMVADLDVLVLSVGAAGTVLCSQVVISGNGILGAYLNTTPTEVDTTEAAALTVTADYDAGTAGNTVTLHHMTVELLRAN